ncbi:periplasmic heavy metal sensor [Oleidesulfovibrio sp.]|uniref:periplasmic heavy metal sensor n=1 Tax=Oleidesulfovibrio sp. TaxID=2909707 RepID=UPI003A89DF7F
MKNFRRNVTAFALVLTLGAAGAASAATQPAADHNQMNHNQMNHQVEHNMENGMNHKMGKGHMMGMGHKLQLNEEQQKKYDVIVKKAYKDTTGLREQLWARSAELDALRMNPNAAPELFGPLADSIAELRTKLDKERISMNEKLEKELGISIPLQHGKFISGGKKGCMMMGMKGKMGKKGMKGMMQSADNKAGKGELVACMNNGKGARNGGYGTMQSGPMHNNADEPYSVSFAL